ncbi:hypothetical protein PCC6311_2252 [Synechococcus elongatus PCC 6311]|uniref:Uncharacterized protein n=3 Tax=Synechococcus elongatus TaxID=32046 RepID=Q31L70_SYNE7|nr:conserved hypothetical protein [Synechococcus elongatus PCC 7942 = FACHB-805]AJD57326.1 hypothetical protein M744_05505 [Synechococcus elongatus UTEX 2973]MBD2586922.1 hypothetical protein [Synechococcus elongatus FACHB-242]MBD2687993.1 hypothetical protein [Synechococcus elongatus FACHB-1061]UOW71996.1 hypothetical protein PCC7943_2254 [Synechococcus elongatus PCC 7943]UOW74715.1 hypothetical protein PCC6311_2252 [Synechococcus elongatus PCC 6311]UOW77436.1 hypothetical protein PCC6301pg_
MSTTAVSYSQVQQVSMTVLPKISHFGGNAPVLNCEAGIRLAIAPLYCDLAVLELPPAVQEALQLQSRQQIRIEARSPLGSVLVRILPDRLISLGPDWAAAIAVQSPG